jgi:hypothetical protein
LSELEIFLGVLLACLSALLFITSMIAWKRTGSIKIGLVSMALLIFTIKGIYLSFTGIYYGWMSEDDLMLLLDLSVVVMIYLSVLK